MMMVYMWQAERGKPFYRFQTENRKTAGKMKRRKKFRLAAFGYNCDFWVFAAEFKRPDIARKVLRTFAGGSEKFDKKEDVFFAVINKTNLKKEAA